MKIENLLDLFKRSIKASIKTTKIYDKDCYFITNFVPHSPEGIYVDKETGITIRYAPNKRSDSGVEENIEITEFMYEFDTVTEADFVEPNLSEYEVLDNNDEKIEQFLKGEL